MNVLVTLEAAWHRVPGGTARAALQLVDALASREDVTVTGVSAAHLRPPPTDWRTDVAIRQHRLPRPALYEAWARTSRPRVRGRRGVDVVHSTTIVAPPCGEVPLVVSVHDLAFRRFPDRFGRRAVRLFERCWRQTLNRANAVLSPSVATSADLSAAGLDADRLHQVPIGHQPLQLDPDAGAAVRTQFQLDGPFVLAASTVEPRKNLPALIEAFTQLRSRHPDIRLVLAGPQGWGPTHDQLLQPLDGPTRERVVVTGFVPTETLAALYSEAAVFCYPSLLEGFGLPVVEAMSYGTPVVTSSGTSTEEVAGGAAAMVDPNQPSQIADALDAVLADDTHAAQLAAAGLERAARYTPQAAADATVAVYREVLRS